MAFIAWCCWDGHNPRRRPVLCQGGGGWIYWIHLGRAINQARRRMNEFSERYTLAPVLAHTEENRHDTFMIWFRPAGLAMSFSVIMDRQRELFLLFYCFPHLITPRGSISCVNLRLGTLFKIFYMRLLASVRNSFPYYTIT